MARKKRLNKKQLSVLDDLFQGGLSQQEILDKHRVSAAVFNKWFASRLFCAEFSARMSALNRHSELIIAKYASVAAAKLVQLTESEKAETARKACLDILSLPRAGVDVPEIKDDKNSESERPEELSADTAGKLLAVLADDIASDKPK